MSNDNTTPPLWRVMYEAAANNPAHDGCPDTDHTDYAAELRAVADELKSRPIQVETPVDDYDHFYRRGFKDGVRAVIEWLQTEVQRAEAGE